MNNTKTLNQDLLNQVTGQVVAKILMRVAKDLTDQDLDEIEKLDLDDSEGKNVMKYLYEKIPNMESIIFEELQSVRKQASE
jgi:hypothetical protein